MPNFTSAISAEHAQRAADFVAREVRHAFLWELSIPIASVEVFDSPLEELFYIWWRARTIANKEWLDSFGNHDMRVHAPVTIDDQSYVIDFAIHPGSGVIPDCQMIAVELDGHAFHERTKEQVERRDRRDRALQSAGWRIFHFSFAEFSKNPEQCSLEVIDCASEIALTTQRRQSDRARELSAAR